MSNNNLHAAKNAKNDEFYTQRKDIENELAHYENHFKDKVIYCNCDSEDSNFVKYFQDNFYRLGLKQLIYTDYLEDGVDFRSDYSVKLLNKADIVVTNPPFSLFREYVAQLIEYDKNFLIIGTILGGETKEIFPLIKNNKVWLGCGAPKKYEVPKDYSGAKIEENGKWWSIHGNHCWFTNLTHKKRNEELILFKTYNEDDYPIYDNYDVIEVSKVKDIPADYDDAMGVPVSFLLKYNPNQFKILGHTHSGDKTKITESLRTDPKNKHRGFIAGKQKQPRLIIKVK